MVILRVIHNIFFYLLVIITFFVGTAITYCFVPFNRDKSYPFRRAASIWSGLLLPFSGVKVAVSGLENLPKGQPVIIAANHQGAADIPIVLSSLPLTFRFAIKKELFSIPIFGGYLRLAGYFPVDRKVVLSAYKMVETISAILKAGDSVLIFPEGTRSQDGRLGEFKRGSLLAASKSGVPVVPVAISGSYQILPRGTKLFKPAKVKFTVCPPVYFKSEEDYESKVLEVRDAIAAKL